MNTLTPIPTQIPMDVRVPIVSLDYVYHVGSLNIAHKRPSSYESDCLSVSRCPHAWTHIARLGGYQTFRLDKPGGRFLDVVRVSKLTKSAFERWGLEHEYLVRTPAYKAIIWRDEDTDAPGYSWYLTRKEALESSIDDAPVRQYQISIASPKLLAQRHVTLPYFERDAVELAMMAWAEEVGLDGLWWREVYHPESMSAPRGGIVPTRVHEWSASAINEDFVDDLQELRKFPRPSFIVMPLKDIV